MVCTACLGSCSVFLKKYYFSFIQRKKLAVYQLLYTTGTFKTQKMNRAIHLTNVSGLVGVMLFRSQVNGGAVRLIAISFVTSSSRNLAKRIDLRDVRRRLLALPYRFHRRPRYGNRNGNISVDPSRPALSFQPLLASPWYGELKSRFVKLQNKYCVSSNLIIN